jgi:hypothetical protein
MQTLAGVVLQQPHGQQQQMGPARVQGPGTVHWVQKTAGCMPGRCQQAVAVVLCTTHSSTVQQAAAVQGGYRLAGHRMGRRMIAGWEVQQQQQGSRAAARLRLQLVCMWAQAERTAQRQLAPAAVCRSA